MSCSWRIAATGLHTAGNALDSGWILDARKDYSDAGNKPIRIIAQGRDPSATIDAGLLGPVAPGFFNDGDNELTGIHVSDGDPHHSGLLGAKSPTSVQGRLARLLHAAARGQHHLRDHPGARRR